MRLRTVLKAEEFRVGELDERWAAVVEAVAPERAVRVKECRTRFSTWKDGNGHRFHRAMLCREKDVCHVCSRAYTASLVDDAVDVLGRIYVAARSKMRYVGFELTVPKEAWQRVGMEDLGQMRWLGEEVIKEVFGEGGRYEIGGVVSAHHWHSSNPFAGWYPHLHGLVFDLAVDRKSGEVVHVPQYLSMERIVQMRELWRSKFENRFGATKAKVFDVYLHYSAGYVHLRHRLSYAFRSPVVDMYRQVVVGGGEVDLDVARQLLLPVGGKGKRRIVWFGWLAERRRRNFLERIGLTIERKRQRDSERRRLFCPLCGLEMYREVGEFLTLDEIKAEAGYILLAYSRSRRLTQEGSWRET